MNLDRFTFSSGSVSILEEIMARKRSEIAAAKLKVPQAQLEAQISGLPTTRDFTGQLKRLGLQVIAEVKKASPSAGIIRADFDPVTIAQTYQRHGAACISVLTDEHFFQGHLDFLTAIKAHVAIPVLRKEFILDEYQLLEARVAGADAVLLIAECLPDAQLATLYQQATQIGLHVLVELHDTCELPRVLASGTQLVGINNRDLRTFKTTLNHTLDLLSQIPSDRVVVSESGIKSHADWQMLEQAGVHAILVGESLMRAADIGGALDALRGVV